MSTHERMMQVKGASTWIHEMMARMDMTQTCFLSPLLCELPMRSLHLMRLTPDKGLHSLYTAPCHITKQMVTLELPTHQPWPMCRLVR